MNNKEKAMQQELHVASNRVVLALQLTCINYNTNTVTKQQTCVNCNKLIII